VTGAAALLAASAAFAQQNPRPPADSVGSPNMPWSPPRLVPLEQGVEDRSSLDESLRIQQVDLSVPGGFRQVYHVPGRNDLLMRVNGGMYAVFPESFYRRGKGGVTALIPPGTVFYIGEPPTDLPLVPGAINAAPPPMIPLRNQISSRVNSKWDRRVPAEHAGVVRMDGEIDPDAPVGAGGRDSGAPPPPPVPVPRIPRLSAPVIRTVATDEGFRMRRLSELLDRAAEAATSEKP